MQEFKPAWRLKWWPSPQDYNEAIQNPDLNFQDSTLAAGRVVADNLGIPRPMTGAFASVYRLRNDSGDQAVRCFLRDVVDAEERYLKISEFVLHDDLIATVNFDFLRTGIRVNSEWFPILKMEWVEGTTLDQYLAAQIGDSLKLESLAEKFRLMCKELRRAGIAHGDLQHGNIMVRGDELVLVDYDGMYVPSLSGFVSNELGHRNYQHPDRAERHFGPYLDNFSAWVIYASLRALAVDSSLYESLQVGDDCLLFRNIDFLNPSQSCAFAALERHESEELQHLAKLIRWHLQSPLEDIPFLGDDTESYGQLDPIAPDVPAKRARTVARDCELPEWLEPVVLVDRDNQGAAQIRGRRTARSGANFGSLSTGRPAQSNSSLAVTWQSSPSFAIEPELLAPAPRPTSFRGTFGQRPEFWQVLMLFNPLVWVMLSYLFLIVPETIALQYNGVDVQGRVESLHLITPREDSGKYKINDVSGALESRQQARPGAEYYEVNYAYSTRNGNWTHSGTASVPAANGRSLPAGKPINVRVLPAKPSVNSPNFFPEHQQIDGFGLNARLGSNLLISLFFLIVNLICEWLIWRTALKHRRMAARGTPVFGRVLKLYCEHLDRGQLTYSMSYEYDDGGGLRLAHCSISEPVYKSLHEMQEITVLRSIDDHDLAIPYVCCLYRAK